jgi:hypothetical protein
VTAKVVMPVIVRVGETEAQWGTITFTTEDFPITEEKIRQQTASFLREAADMLESPDNTEGVDNAAPR